MPSKQIVKAACTNCKTTLEIQKRSYNSNIKLNGTYICQKCRCSETEIQKQTITDETRQKISKSNKEKWESGIFNKEKNCSKAIESNKSEPKNIKISNSIKENWNNSKYKNKKRNINKTKISKSLIEYWKTADKSALSYKIKSAWKNGKTRINLINGIEKRNTEAYRQKMSESSKKLWLNKSYRQKMANARKNSGSDSILEIIASKLLNSLNIEHKKEEIDGWTWDVAIRKDDGKTILIDIQGEYFHNLNETKNRDILKYNNIIDNHKDRYEIHYLNEIDFYSIGSLKKKLFKIIGIEDRQIDFSFDDINVSECDKDDGNKFLACYHYLNPSRNGIYFGSFLKDELIAVCVFSPIIRMETATSSNIDRRKTLELSRFCIHPSHQKKNFASWFLSKCLKKLPNQIEYIVAFSDTTLGHSGTIYKACGFKNIGFCPRTYWYIDENGNYLHKKSVYNQAIRNKMVERQYSVLHNLIKIKGKRIIKFLKQL